MSLEANKIAAAILVGGMLTLSSGLIANMIYGGHEGGEEHAAGAASPAAPAAKPAAVEPISGLLASADVAAGEKIAVKCQSCHTFGKGEANKVGPNLYGVLGGPTAHKEDYNYDDAIKNLKTTWTYENVNHFIANPKGFAPGTKMTFPGLPKAQDRADVIAFLRTKSDNPIALPTPDEIKAAEDAAKQAAAAPEPEAKMAAAAPAQPEGAGAPAAAPAGEDAVKLIAAADPAAGEKVAVKCKACHDFTKGGPNKIGPNLWGVVGGPSAHKGDFNYDDAIKNLKITWDFANLDKFITNPKKFAPGTKMTFPGLPKAQDRANLLRWLRDQSDSPVPLPQ
jgi:cytochrome c